mgnify:CR=1 FL=1
MNNPLNVKKLAAVAGKPLRGRQASPGLNGKKAGDRPLFSLAAFRKTPADCPKQLNAIQGTGTHPVAAFLAKHTERQSLKWNC